VARITVQLGVSNANFTSFTIDSDDIDRDDPALADRIFAAANRVDRVDDDIDRLELDVQKRVRRLIDQFSAPSMSVGDKVIVDLNGGLRQRTFTVEPVGWSVVDTEVIITKPKPEEAQP
jgi:hypothetical protein